jgi:hypothetical protein
MEEKSIVIQYAKYEPPRVLRMDLTKIPYCSSGAAANIVCSSGAGF